MFRPKLGVNRPVLPGDRGPHVCVCHALYWSGSQPGAFTANFLHPPWSEQNCALPNQDLLDNGGCGVHVSLTAAFIVVFCSECWRFFVDSRNTYQTAMTQHSYNACFRTTTHRRICDVDSRNIHIVSHSALYVSENAHMLIVGIIFDANSRSAVCSRRITHMQCLAPAVCSTWLVLVN